MKVENSIIGYPRIGELRELKFWTEDYFKKEISFEELEKRAKTLRENQWKFIKENGIDYVPSNDFSYYDGLLDTAFMLNIIPKEYKKLSLKDIDTYFAMARGYQGEEGDIKSLAMKKWFNTNYHYMVPVFEDDTEVKLNSNKVFKEYEEALKVGVETKPVLIGPFTLLKLSKYKESKGIKDFAKDVTAVYKEIINKLETLGAKWIQIDEPILVADLNKEDIEIFTKIYEELLKEKGCLLFRH